jgi:hypothetical protein
MWTLVDCDIYRDGGSYGATLANGEQLISLWLEVGPWNRPSERRYVGLFVSDGRRPDAKEQRVPSGEPEREWLRNLEEVDRSAASQSALDRLDELITKLRDRCPAPTP